MPNAASFSQRLARPYIAWTVAGAVLVGWIASYQIRPSNAENRPAPAVSEKAIADANNLSQAFRSASERVLPAVVSIHHTVQPKLAKRDAAPRRGQRPQLPPGFEDNPLFKRFFEDMPGLDEGDLMPRGPQQSSGSGVIIDPAGIVLTNNHVVAGGGKVVVRLHDGREIEAAEIKTDPKTDLAIVKLKGASKLPVAVLGDSDKLEIGDWVLALGQPFGLEDTVTAGIISAKNRGINISAHAEFLQTDAAINPGNSGGPLVNLRGEVIGINTAISSTSGGYQGIGFAVPVNVAKWVSSQLLKDGTVHRSFLGVVIQKVDQALADQFELASPNGVLVTEVQPNSPAAEAGLQARDVITEFGGAAVNDQRQLQAVVSRSAIGSKQPVVVLRDGKRLTLHVTLKEQPAGFGERKTSGKDEPEQRERSSSDALGLEVAPLDKDVAQKLGLAGTEGVVVTSVERDSLAASAGIEPGMAITQVGRKAIKNVSEFEAAVKNAPLEKGVLLLLKTQEGSRYVVLKP